jgi:NAD(P)-dependent dehydrogenase (short-subunit alcohol dehydrogenase family)
MRKTILITGASSGIGLETALHLSEQGYEVYASVPEPGHVPAVEEAAGRRGAPLKTVLLDVTDPEGIREAVERVVRESGGIYGLVNNAGLGLRGFFEDLADEEIRRLFDVNVFGVMAVTRAVLPHMRRARQGRILIMSSAGGRIAAVTISAYCAGKFAVEGFGEALALETAPLGLHVSLIEPGLVMTPHFTVNRGQAKASIDPRSPYHAWFLHHERVIDGILGRNRIRPADVARTVRKALEAKRPRLRYIVGWRPRLLIGLRRHLPGEWFERAYLRQVRRELARGGISVGEAPPPSDSAR